MNDKLKEKESLVQPVKLGSKMNSFHQQIIKGAAVAATLPTGVTSTGVPSFADMSTTVIFPDCSGSMSDICGDSTYNDPKNTLKAKIEFCKDAINSFIDNSFAGATKVGVASFPEQVVVEPTFALHEVKQACSGLRASGGTPMSEPLDYVLSEWKTVTHGIVISDGAPDSIDEVLKLAEQYKLRGIKLDAVHIGDRDENGEALMKNITTITGGIYIKFSNVKAFADSFKFLTPKYRLQLQTSKNPTALLNAAEVKI